MPPTLKKLMGHIAFGACVGGCVRAWVGGWVTLFVPTVTTVLIVHRIVLFWEPDRCFQDGGQENRREVGTYFITISSVY